MTTRIQTPPGTTEVSHAGQPYPIDPLTGTFDCPDDVAPCFLRLAGFHEVPAPAVTLEPAETTTTDTAPDAPADPKEE